MKSLFRTLVAGLGILAGLVGCRAARVPMPVVAYGEATPPARDLIVFLPGRFDRPEDFEKYGFVKAVRDAGMEVDLLAADAHMGYYRNRSILTRLMEDIVKPARTRGIERIWLVGISLGGYGSLAAMAEHPDEFAGALVLAPYLGDDDLAEEMEEAGGPMAWTPPPMDDANHGEAIWIRIREMRESGVLDRVWLAHGENDRFAPGGRQLTTLIGEDHTLVRDGDHDWATWKRLFREIVSERGFFFGRLSPPPPPGPVARGRASD